MKRLKAELSAALAAVPPQIEQMTAERDEARRMCEERSTAFALVPSLVAERDELRAKLAALATAPSKQGEAIGQLIALLEPHWHGNPAECSYCATIQRAREAAALAAVETP